MPECASLWGSYKSLPMKYFWHERICSSYRHIISMQTATKNNQILCNCRAVQEDSCNAVWHHLFEQAPRLRRQYWDTSAMAWASYRDSVKAMIFTPYAKNQITEANWWLHSNWKFSWTRHFTEENCRLKSVDYDLNTLSTVGCKYPTFPNQMHLGELELGIALLWWNNEAKWYRLQPGEKRGPSVAEEVRQVIGVQFEHDRVICAWMSLAWA